MMNNFIKFAIGLVMFGVFSVSFAKNEIYNPPVCTTWVTGNGFGKYFENNFCVYRNLENANEISFQFTKTDIVTGNLVAETFGSCADARFIPAEDLVNIMLCNSPNFLRRK
jgi:hypothetical protein